MVSVVRAVRSLDQAGCVPWMAWSTDHGARWPSRRAELAETHEGNHWLSSLELDNRTANTNRTEKQAPSRTIYDRIKRRVSLSSSTARTSSSTSIHLLYPHRASCPQHTRPSQQLNHRPTIPQPAKMRLRAGGGERFRLWRAAGVRCVTGQAAVGKTIRCGSWWWDVEVV